MNFTLNAQLIFRNPSATEIFCICIKSITNVTFNFISTLNEKNI